MEIIMNSYFSEKILLYILTVLKAVSLHNLKITEIVFIFLFETLSTLYMNFLEHFKHLFLENLPIFNLIF